METMSDLLFDDERTELDGVIAELSPETRAAAEETLRLGTSGGAVPRRGAGACIGCGTHGG
jgi:hypothetical protein